MRTLELGCRNTPGRADVCAYVDRVADGEAVVALSKQLGLDQAKLLKDMRDPEITKILERNYQLANALGINGTPAFVIGERRIPGARDAAGLAAIIAQERAKKKAAEKTGQ